MWTVESCAKKSVYDEPEHQLWEVINNHNPNYKLKRGYILRIGRVQLKIKDYRIESAIMLSDQISSPMEDNIIDIQTKESKSNSPEDVCRICFGIETSSDNPLLSLCNCTGSTKFIHYMCLKTWLSSKALERIGSDVISYYWKEFQCEICTCFYPCKLLITVIVSVMHSGKRFDMVDIPRPLNNDFLLLESINKTKGAIRTIHMLIPSNTGKVYKLGRGHEADIKITDISVSRLHAHIKCTPKGFVIEDNSSKFGILVHLENKITYNFCDNPLLQFGKTRIAIAIQE